MPVSSRFDTLHSAATGTVPGKVYRGDGFRTVVMQASGIGTATITFEVSVDNNTWVGILAASPVTGTGALTLTASGAVSMAAWPYMRARISAWTSGAITVVAAGMP
jgi:L-aminopeptidase/D-esterase-like protein